MKILNLGCGTKVSSKDEVVNIDWSIYLRIKNNRLLRSIAPLILKGERLEKFNKLPDNVMVYNLKREEGLPFESDSVDVAYHSHLLEHFDKVVAKKFLSEVLRVLKPAGIHRIVVPDLEKACRAYIEHFFSCELNPNEADNHESYIAALIEQSVRREAYGTSQQKPLRRFVENILLGDARRRGETHQWMYDRISLKTILIELGYKEAVIQEYNTSLIPNWNEYELDIDKNGNQYKAQSLYVEGIK